MFLYIRRILQEKAFDKPSNFRLPQSPHLPVDHKITIHLHFKFFDFKNAYNLDYSKIFSELRGSEIIF